MANQEVLAPFKTNSPNTVSALRITLNKGELAMLGSLGSSLTVEVCQSPELFRVERLPTSPTTVCEVDAQADEWNLHTQTVILKSAGRGQALLLGPSLVGQSLYGGEIPRSDSGLVPLSDPLRAKYGCIQTDYDPDEGEWGVNVLMPDLPYRNVSNLTLIEIS